MLYLIALEVISLIENYSQLVLGTEVTENLFMWVFNIAAFVVVMSVFAPQAFPGQVWYSTFIERMCYDSMLVHVIGNGRQQEPNYPLRGSWRTRNSSPLCSGNLAFILMLAVFVTTHSLINRDIGFLWFLKNPKSIFPQLK